MSLLRADYYIHILPGIDDGAEDAQISIWLLEINKQHGVQRAVVTSRCIPYRNSVESFLIRRQKAIETLGKRKILKFAFLLIRGRFPVVFGSDAHGTVTHLPDMDAIYKMLAAKLSKDGFTVVKILATT